MALPKVRKQLNSHSAPEQIRKISTTETADKFLHLKQIKCIRLFFIFSKQNKYLCFWVFFFFIPVPEPDACAFTVFNEWTVQLFDDWMDDNEP